MFFISFIFINIMKDKIRKILRESYYDRDKLYSKRYIQQRLSKAPKYIKSYLTQLEEIDCVNAEGENNICVKIPEVIHVYLFGSSF